MVLTKNAAAFRVTDASSGRDPYGVLGLMADAGGGEEQAIIAAIMRGAQAGGGEPAPVPVRGSHLARPGDSCPECRYALQVSGMEYECPACHEVFEAADIQDVLPMSKPEGPGAASLRGRLRIVGPSAGWFQSDMDRTNPGEVSEQHKNSTYAELLRFNKEYESRGGSPFPLDVLHDVAENYYIIQQNSVKRSMMKKGIFAALVFHSCIRHRLYRRPPTRSNLIKVGGRSVPASAPWAWSNPLKVGKGSVSARAPR